METADRSGVAREFGKGRAAEQMRHVGFLGMKIICVML